MLQASQKSSGVAAGQSEVTCHKHALSWKIFYLWTKTQISKTKKISDWHLLCLTQVLNVLGHLGPPTGSSGAVGFFCQDLC